MLKKSLRVQNNVIAWAVVVIGLLQSIGFITGLRPLQFMGQLTGASPLPKVFGQINGFEYWAAQYEFDFVFKDRPPQHLIADSQLFSKISGPHLVHIAYESPLAAMPLSNEAFWLRPAKSALCNHGKIARDWQIEGELRQVTVTITSKTAGQNKVWKKLVECSN